MRQDDAFAARPEAAHLDDHLAELGLDRWRSVLHSWLPHFDGWRSLYLQDESIGEDDAPTDQVCALLVQYAHNGQRPSDSRFAEDLAHLDFLTWRASHDKPGSRWNCLEETFPAFARRGEVTVWQYDTEYPPPGLIKYWLLGRLYAALQDQSEISSS
jgi:hypothetical protein